MDDVSDRVEDEQDDEDEQDEDGDGVKEDAMDGSASTCTPSD